MKKLTILDEILNHKQKEVDLRKEKNPLIESEIEKARSARPLFLDSLKTQLDRGHPAVIAEVKKASPSKGVLRESFDPASIAISYAQAGAVCLSVLTDEKYFQGHDQYIASVKKVCNLPILRKEFIVDTYQIYESKLLGADCILLIVSALDDFQLKQFCNLATELNLDVLVEVHNQEELDRVLTLNFSMVGINNRNLHTFVTDIQTTIDLLQLIPDDKLVVSESGIHSKEQVQILQKNDVNAFLVGESFMRAKDPGAELNKLFFV